MLKKKKVSRDGKTFCIHGLKNIIVLECNILQNKLQIQFNTYQTPNSVVVVLQK